MKVATTYVARFANDASVRLRRALAALATEPQNICHELHRIAGDAGMLGLIEISNDASHGSKAAREWVSGSPTPEQRMTCARLLRSLLAQVDQLSPNASPAQESIPTGRLALIIDDSQLVADELSEGLGAAGFATAVASTAEGVECAMTGRVPEVVLLDANMPGLDVATLCQMVRRHAPNAKLVIVSGSPERELEKLVGELGADGFVSKLHGLPRIIERIQALVGGAS